MANILIIDDEESVCRIFSRMQRSMGHEPDYAYSLTDGLHKAREKTQDLVLLDIFLPDGNGLEAVPEFLSASGDPEVIIITGQGDKEAAEMAARSGAWASNENPSSGFCPFVKSLTEDPNEKYHTDQGRGHYSRGSAVRSWGGDRGHFSEKLTDLQNLGQFP